MDGGLKFEIENHRLTEKAKSVHVCIVCAIEDARIARYPWMWLCMRAIMTWSIYDGCGGARGGTGRRARARRMAGVDDGAP